LTLEKYLDKLIAVHLSQIPTKDAISRCFGATVSSLKTTTNGVHMSELGDILRSAREKKNVSLAEASRVTRIKLPFLEALEDGEYGLLPGLVYVTGFLRNYANYLGLQPDDIVQEYYALTPPAQASVKAATRVLENGHRRYIRRRLLWGMGLVALFLAGGYAIKQYDEIYAKPSYSAPLITPANLGAPLGVAHKPAPRQHLIHLSLKAASPAWVRVNVDNHIVFHGMLRARMPRKSWTAHHSIYVMTPSGRRIIAVYNGKQVGALASKSGWFVYVATPTHWQHVL
jgi:Helix-turn-helix domain